MNNDITQTDPEPKSRVFEWLSIWLGGWAGKFTLVYGLLVLAHILYIYFHSADDENLSLISNIASVVIDFGPFVMALRVSTHKTLAPRTRRAWRLIAFAYLSLMFGSVLWTYFENILGTQPFPSLADPVYLMFFPLMLWALLSMVAKLPSSEGRIKFALDTGIIMIVGGMTLWFFILKPMTDASTGDELTLALTLAYPIGDLVLLFGITSLILRRSSFDNNWAVRYLLGGIILNFLADISFSYQTVQGVYQTASFVDGLYTFACFPVMLGAHYHYMTASQDSGPEATIEADPIRKEKRQVFWLPYAAIALAYGIILKYVFDQPDTPLSELIVMSAVLTALVIIRQVMAMRENLRANVAISELQERVQGIYAASKDAIGFSNFDRKLVDFNHSFGTLTGYSREELLGMSIDELIAPEYRESSRAAADLTFATGVHSEQEKELVRKDGIRVNVIINAYAVRDADGKPTGLAAVIRDVTQRKRAEIERDVISDITIGAASSASLDDLLKLVHQSIGKVIDAENCYVALYDKSLDQVIWPLFIDKHASKGPEGKSCNDLTGFLLKMGQPTLLTGASIRWLTEKENVGFTGKIPAIWMGVPLMTPEGTIGVLVVQHYENVKAYDQPALRFLSSVGDQIALAIERKRTDELVRQSEERFRDLFENAPIAYHEIDMEGRYVRINRTEELLLGYTNEELVGRHASDFIVEKSSREAVADKLSGKLKLQAIERTFIRKDGRRIPVLIEDRLIKDQAGAVTGIRSTLQDITALKMLEEKVQRGQKLESIGQLAAGIAHEINTPTQFVGDNVRFLKDSFDDFRSVLEKTDAMIALCRAEAVIPEFVGEIEATIKRADVEYLIEEVPKAFKQALAGVERIAKIVQSMKDFAHPGSNATRAADLNKAIESTITVASNEWRYIADLETDYEPNLPLVQCHIGELNQVVLNMIVNAAHAITDNASDQPDGKGKIKVATKLLGDVVEISIGDSGAGMSKEVKNKIFDPFFTTKEVGKGSGQGLAISHSIVVDMHKGTIDVESEVGVGTTFIIRIPVAEALEAESIEIESKELVAA